MISYARLTLYVVGQQREVSRLTSCTLQLKLHVLHQNAVVISLFSLNIPIDIDHFYGTTLMEVCLKSSWPRTLELILSHWCWPLLLQWQSMVNDSVLIVSSLLPLPLFAYHAGFVDIVLSVAESLAVVLQSQEPTRQNLQMQPRQSRTGHVRLSCCVWHTILHWQLYSGSLLRICRLCCAFRHRWFTAWDTSRSPLS